MRAVVTLTLAAIATPPGSLAAVTLTPFVSCPAVTARATIVIVNPPPAASESTRQTSGVRVQAPIVVVTDSTATGRPKVSVTTTAVAAADPRFSTVTR